VPEPHQPAAVAGHAANFARRYREKLGHWREHLRDLRRANGRTVIWGGGSKGVTFLNVLGVDSSIEYVVDVNPHKQGKYVGGTGQRIVPPAFLGEYKPTDVFVMNPLYEHEIAGTLRVLGLEPRLHCM
jgi:hypothetical protein